MGSRSSPARLEAGGYLKADGISPLSTRRWILDLDPPHAVRGANPAPPRTRRRLPPAPGAPELKNLSKNVLKTSGGHKNGRLPDGLFDAITDTTQTDPKTAGASIGKVGPRPPKAGYTAADVSDFKKWWWGDKKMRQRPPTSGSSRSRSASSARRRRLTKPDEPHEYFVPPNMSQSDPYDRPEQWLTIAKDSGDPKFPPGF